MKKQDQAKDVACRVISRGSKRAEGGEKVCLGMFQLQDPWEVTLRR